MRLFSIPPPTLLAGFLAVLIGYASSAAIIWQAAIVAGATTAQISGWMTALGLAMGVSTLTLTLWYRVPVLTAWSTPVWGSDQFWAEFVQPGRTCKPCVARGVVI